MRVAVLFTASLMRQDYPSKLIATERDTRFFILMPNPQSFKMILILNDDKNVNHSPATHGCGGSTKHPESWNISCHIFTKQNMFEPIIHKNMSSLAVRSKLPYHNTPLHLHAFRLSQQMYMKTNLPPDTCHSGHWHLWRFDSRLCTITSKLWFLL